MNYYIHTPPASWVGWEYSIQGCSVIDKQVENYETMGTPEVHAVRIVLDGEEFKFRTMADFKNALSRDEHPTIKARSIGADLHWPAGNILPKGRGKLTYHKALGSPVVLPERDSAQDPDARNLDESSYAEGWNACLDKVKELNP